jgi:hypothetical protein
MRQAATVTLHTSQMLNANHRLHWREVASRKAVLREFGRLSLGRELTPVTDKVRITAEFKFPTVRTRDRANLHPTVKHLVDGIVKAGILVDDSDEWIDGPDIVISDEKSGRPGYVVVTVALEDERGGRRARLAAAEAQIMREREEAARAKALARAGADARRKR